MTTLSREELYELVWAEPMRTIAARLNISDVGVAKHCRKMSIPLPGRGYWAKKAAGHRLRIAPLPALPPNDSRTPRSATIQAVPAEIEPAPIPEPIAAQIAFEADPKHAITVVESLRSPHPLVRSTMQAFDASGKKEGEYLNNWHSHQLDIEVTKACLRRALRLADALLKALEARGWKVSLASGNQRDDRKTWVTLLGQKIPFGIREPLRKVANEPAKPTRLPNGQLYTPDRPKYRDEPSGKLALIIRNSWGHSVSQSWPDTASQPVEQRLHEFMIALVSEAHEMNERHARFEAQEKVRQEAERVRKAEQEQREAEFARREALDQQASTWAKCRQLREYIQAVRTRVDVLGQCGAPANEVIEWLAWAEHYAQSLDPLERPLEVLAGERICRPSY